MAEECDAATIAKFGNLISSVKNLKISFVDDPDLDMSGNERVDQFSDTFKAKALENKAKYYQNLVSSINQQRRLLCDLKVIISRIRATRKAESTFIPRNGRMSIKLRLVYRQNTFNIVNLQCLLGSTFDDVDGNKTNNPMMPIIYSVKLNIKPNFIDSNPTISTFILQRVLSSCPNITRVYIVGQSRDYYGFYGFQSDLFNTLKNDTYIMTPAKLDNFLNNSTPIVDRLTRSLLISYRSNFDTSSRQLLV